MVDPSDLSCQELVELVTEYLEDALSFAERARFDAHIADCDGCALYLEQMRLTVRALGHLSEDRISPDARARLLVKFRDWKRAAEDTAAV